MARSTVPRPAVKAAPAAAAEKPKPKEGSRETAEAIAVAFILALIVRGFVAEAFVIPTGSMAPTLMGRHKEITCPQCGFVYAVNASEESEGTSAYPRRVYAGTCVNCRYQSRVDGLPSFKGDRILVMKFPYDLPWLPGASSPTRWDVVVFRYPEEPETSYIKRLVGLPGDLVRVWYGDIYIRRAGEKDFKIERKPPAHQRAMQMTVYDDTRRASSLKDSPEWQRWAPKVTEGWGEDATSPGTFTSNASTPGWSELRYRHLVPAPAQWREIEAGEPLTTPPAPTLVTDFYSYNTPLFRQNYDLTGEVSHDQESAWLQPHWVGDLTLSCHVAPDSAAGSARLELIEGGVSNRCEIDLKTGEATLSHGVTLLGKAPTGVSWAARHEVTFANVDNRLTLWVDGTPTFQDGLAYDDIQVPLEAHPAPTADDLAPARVATRGAKVAVSDLVLKRDIYYTNDPMRTDYGSAWDPRVPRTPAELAKFLGDPKSVAALGPLGWADFQVRDGYFLMLGDNSPRSKDSRGWEDKDAEWDPRERQKWEVPEKLITGKAFCVYWPHGKPFGPDIRPWPDLQVPFRPYFERMKLIH